MRIEESVCKKLQYIRALYAREDELLERVAASLPEGKRGMQIGAEEGAVLAWLVKAFAVKTIVEIGTAAGYSALWMARALPENGSLHTIELNPEHAALARKFFAEDSAATRIILHEGKAASVLEKLPPQEWDMVFIDADKAAYPFYLNWAEKNLRVGGLLVADNTLLFGALYDEQQNFRVSNNMKNAMQNFNQGLADNENFSTVLLPTGEGLTIARKLL
jgi:predicted O-methyltransferase YrrM